MSLLITPYLHAVNSLRQALPALCAALFLCALTACSGQGTAENASGVESKDTPSVHPSRLVFAGEGVTTINPLLNAHDELPSLIFSGLLKYDVAGHPVPDVARDFSYDAKALSYTFHLRDDVYWQDGEKLDASDVAFTYGLLMGKTPLICPVTSNFEDVTEIEIPDPLTVVFHLKAPNVALASYFTLGLLPEHLLKGEDVERSSFNQHPVGTGRYAFAGWDRAAGRIFLKAHERYYGTVPEIKELIYATVAEESVKSVMLSSGEADLAWLNARYATEFKGREGYRSFDFSSADLRALSMDMRTPFWQKNADSIAVLNYALDKEALVQAVLMGRGERAYGLLQLNPATRNVKADLYPYSLPRFHEAMQALGWVRGADGIYAREGERFHFSIQVRDYEEERVDLSALVSAMLKDAGVEMEVVRVPRFDFKKGYNGYLSGMAYPFDPDALYSATVTGGSDNTMGYSSPAVDALLLKARHESAPEKRMALYRDFEELYARTPGIVPLVYLEGNYVAVKTLTGPDTRRLLGHHAAGVFWNVEDWSFEEPAIADSAGTHRD